MPLDQTQSQLRQPNHQLVLHSQRKSRLRNLDLSAVDGLNLEARNQLHQKHLHLHDGQLLSDAHPRTVVERLECVRAGIVACEVVPAVGVEGGRVFAPDERMEVHDRRGELEDGALGDERAGDVDVFDGLAGGQSN